MSDIPKKNSHVFQKFSHVFQKISDIFWKNSHVFSEISHVLVCSLRYSWNKIGENVLFSPKFHSLLSFVLWCIGFKSASLWDEGGAIRDITLYPAKDATCVSGLSSYFLEGKSMQNGCFRVFLLVFKQQNRCKMKFSCRIYSFFLEVMKKNSIFAMCFSQYQI